MSSSSPLYIGSGAGFSGDRLDASGPVVEELARLGGSSVLIFETLAERTLAAAQLVRRTRPDLGYEPLLDDMLRPVLQACLDHGIRIVGNFGAANPLGAARRLHQLARSLGTRTPRIAVIEGDDLSDPSWIAALSQATGGATERLEVVSANAYIGAMSMADALREGADIVVAGRVADPALVLAPAMAHFGWADNDWDRLAGATMAGHLLECGAQVSGGFYADPGIKHVPDLHNLGYPLAQLFDDGSCIVGKPRGTGGVIDRHTVTEQLLYELHDPAAYVTPDVVADITNVVLEEIGSDQVRIFGVKGHPKTDTLKINVCYTSGWLAEAEISYAGVRAEARARMAADIVRKRLGSDFRMRCDLIGVSSVLSSDRGEWLNSQPVGEALDVRLRIALRDNDQKCAQRLLQEVTALYTCGPAGGGGVRTYLRPTLGTLSCLLMQEILTTRHVWVEAEDD